MSNKRILFAESINHLTRHGSGYRLRKKISAKYALPFFPKGLLYRRGTKKSRISTNISFYLRNDTRDGQIGHCCNGRRIGARVVTFPIIFSNPDPDFNVTIFFNVKQLEHGARKRYTYNGRLIGSRLFAIFNYLE